MIASAASPLGVAQRERHPDEHRVRRAATTRQHDAPADPPVRDDDIAHHGHDESQRWRPDAGGAPASGRNGAVNTGTASRDDRGEREMAGAHRVVQHEPQREQRERKQRRGQEAFHRGTRSTEARDARTGAGTGVADITASNVRRGVEQAGGRGPRVAKHGVGKDGQRGRHQQQRRDGHALDHAQSWRRAILWRPEVADARARKRDRRQQARADEQREQRPARAGHRPRAVRRPLRRGVEKRGEHRELGEESRQRRQSRDHQRAGGEAQSEERHRGGNGLPRPRFLVVVIGRSR